MVRYFSVLFYILFYFTNVSISRLLVEFRQRSIYTYPLSSPPSPTSPTHARPLGVRLRALQAELDSLEAELSDPSNPLLHADVNSEGAKIDPGELMKGLVDVRGRLEKVKKGKEGRGRLVGVIMGKDNYDKEEFRREVSEVRKKDARKGHGEDESLALAELDHRVGELEQLIGSSSIALDEVCRKEVGSLVHANWCFLHLSEDITVACSVATNAYQTQYSTYAPYTTASPRLNIKAIKAPYF